MGLADLVQDPAVVRHQDYLEAPGQILEVPEQSSPALLVEVGRRVVEHQRKWFPGREFLGQGGPQTKIERVPRPVAQGMRRKLALSVEAPRWVQIGVERRRRVPPARQQ